jgi:hypothetical protein
MPNGRASKPGRALSLVLNADLVIDMKSLLKKNWNIYLLGLRIRFFSPMHHENVFKGETR